MNIRQLAKLCGVSRTTVSLALREDMSISASTRARIQALAAKLGYHPDPDIALQMSRIARRGRKVRVSTLGLLSPWPEQRAWQNNWILEQYHDGIIDQATDLGYRVEEFWLRAPGMNCARLVRILRYRGIHGVVVLNHPESTAAGSLDLSGLAAVALGRTLAQPGVPAVDHDHFGGMRQALSHLNNRGYRRIGLALFDDWQERIRTGHQWEAAFALHQAGIARGDRLPVFVGLRSETVAFARWFEKHRPEAVLCDYPWARELLLSKGVAVPRTTGFACLMWRDASDGCAGIDMNCVEAGRIATALLHAKLSLKARPRDLAPASGSLALQVTLVSGLWRDEPSLCERHGQLDSQGSAASRLEA